MRWDNQKKSSNEKSFLFKGIQFIFFQPIFIDNIHREKTETNYSKIIKQFSIKVATRRLLFYLYVKWNGIYVHFIHI